MTWRPCGGGRVSPVGDGRGVLPTRSPRQPCQGLRVQQLCCRGPGGTCRAGELCRGAPIHPAVQGRSVAVTPTRPSGVGRFVAGSRPALPSRVGLSHGASAHRRSVDGFRATNLLWTASPGYRPTVRGTPRIQTSCGRKPRDTDLLWAAPPPGHRPPVDGNPLGRDCPGRSLDLSRENTGVDTSRRPVDSPDTAGVPHGRHLLRNARSGGPTARHQISTAHMGVCITPWGRHLTVLQACPNDATSILAHPFELPDNPRNQTVEGSPYWGRNSGWDRLGPKVGHVIYLQVYRV